MLTIFKLLLQVTLGLSEYVERKQLMDAGEARAIRGIMEKANDRLQAATQARVNAGRRFRDRNRVPDDKDPNLRD